MPLVHENLDNGFSGYMPDVPVAPPPQEPNYFASAADAAMLLNPMTAGPAIVKNLPLAAAAFRMDNAVVNGFQWLTRPSFKPDPSFDVKQQLMTDGLWDRYRDNFLTVQSPQEYQFVAQKIHQENTDRQTLARAGAAGTVLSMGAGLADPTTLIPFIGEEKGIFAILKAALLGGTAAAIDEVPMRLNQETRTNADSAFSIAGGTVLGGILGGAVTFLHRMPGQSLNAALDEAGARMGELPGHQPIPDSVAIQKEIEALPAKHEAELKALPPETNIEPIQKAHAAERSDLEAQLESAKTQELTIKTVDEHLGAALGPGAAVGADVVQRDAGGLKNMLGIGERLTRIAGPVTSVLGQRVSRVGRQIMAELSTAGLRLENNAILDAKGNVIGAIPSNQGGTVESIINSRRGDVLGLLNRSYEHYADYVFGKGGGGEFPLRNTRAAVVGNVQRRAKIGPNQKMNRKEFFEAVGDAMLHDDQHPVPEVAAAAVEHRQLYNDLLEEAQAHNLIPKEINLLGDTSFLNRLYNTDAINRDPNRFLELLQDHMNSALQEDFGKVHDGYTHAQTRDNQRLSDMMLPLADATALRDRFKDELKALDAAENDTFGPMEELISSYRSEAAKRAKDINRLNRELTPAGVKAETRSAKLAEIARLTQERNAFRTEVGKLQELGGPDLAARAQRRAELKFRMRNLNRNQFFMEEKYRKKFTAIEDLEQSNIDTMHRAIGSGHNALQEIDNISETSQKSIDRATKAVDSVVDQWVKLGNQIETLKAKPENADLSLENPNEQVVKLLDFQDKQGTTLDRLMAAQENLRSIQNIDRTEGGVADARGAVQEAMDAMVEKLSELNNRRAARAAKLEKDAEKFDQASWQKRQSEIETRMDSRRETTAEKLREMGAEDPHGALETGKGDFRERAKEISQLAMDRIRGTNVRLAGYDAMADKRGTELARTLSIPSDKLTPYGFLDLDAERALHAYTNTLLPDIELTKRLGPFAPDGEINTWFKQLNEEEHAITQKVEDNFRNPLDKDGKRTARALSPKDTEELGRLLKGVSDEYKSIRINLDAVIRRLRHQWGVAENPDSYVSRGVRIVQGWQALRFLGGVVISSAQDAARPIMKYGLSRTMSSAWLPMISNWKTVRMSMKEAQRAYVAVETMTSERAHQLTDTIAVARRKTAGEAALEWGVSKLPIIAGFAPWTDVMKTISTMAYHSKVMDSLEDVLANAAKGSSTLRESTEFLNSLGWDSAMQSRIYKQMTSGGAEKIGGTWVPATENWTDAGAVRAYRAATYHEASATIVTPGVELPKIMNASATGKILFALKSFAMSSTSKTLMAGLQQRDMAVANGVMISLALGALSVYLRTTIAGGTAAVAMQTWTPQEWMQRAIDSSGLLGVISLATAVASDATAAVSGGETSGQKAIAQIRHAVGAYNIGDPKSSLIEDAFGPAANLADTVAAAIATKGLSASEIHRIRQLLPFQNVSYLRWLFDRIENSVGGNR